MPRLNCLAAVALIVSGISAAAAQTPAETPSTRSDVLLRADRLIDDRDGRQLIAEGNVEVRVEERVLRADRVIYDLAKETIRAQGNVRITDAQGGVQFADEIEIDDDFENGFATRFATRLSDNAVATASSAIRTSGTRNSLEQVIYTGCPICAESEDQPTWSLRARRAVQNQETQMISYQDAVLEIRGVPVLYIPYFAHPDPTSKRRSGLLTPDAGVSSKLGAFYEQPYYLALSPSQDITFRPVVSSNVNPLLKLDYRKRFFSGYVSAEGSFTYEQDFDSRGNKFGDEAWRSHIYGGGRFDLSQDWSWGFGVERQSDDLYDQRYDIDGEDDLRGLFASQPRQLLSQLFLVGQRTDFYLEASALSFQGLRAGDDDAAFPRVAPSLFAQKVYDFGSWGRVSADASAAVLMRDVAETLPNGDPSLDSARATVSGEWRAHHVVGPGVVVEPFAQTRGDFYRVDDGSGAGPRDISRVLALGGVQASMPFVRRTAAADIVVEPIVMVAYGGTEANMDGIPNEDSLLFEMDDSNLFEPNAVTNFDLWEGGARAAFGLSARAAFGDGIEVSGLVGRRWREKPDPAFSALSNLSGERSDYVASAKVDVGPNIHVASRVRFDDSFNFNRIDIDSGLDVWRLQGRARYFLIDQIASGAKEEGVIIDGRMRIATRWSALYQQFRNITDKRDIRQSIGIAYQDDCSFFSLSYERSGAFDRTLGPSESIRFNFVLTGLGGTSDNSFD
ncbi:LPS assembly protein LptD [bacterium]|nr:LPS assembly protein LptD [bacterium]